jgi:hypothetical protein
MNNYIIVPSIYRNKIGDEIDSQISVDLVNSSKELIEFDRSVNIDLKELYEKEKSASFKIRPVYNISYLYNNIYSGTTTTKYEDELIYPLKSSLIIQSKNVRKGLLQSYEFDFFRPKTKNAFGFESISAFTYNWNYYLTYPSSEDDKKILSIGFKGKDFEWVAGDGIPFVSENITINGFNVTKIICGLNHNLNLGESVMIKIDNNESLHNILSFGDGSFNSEKTIINIININDKIKGNVSGTLRRVTNSANSGETISKYYIRKHKVIKGGDRVVATKAGFQSGIYDGIETLSYDDNNNKFPTKRIGSNKSYNFTIQDEIDIEGIVDNRNRPLTELYLTILFKGYSGFFASKNKPMKQGWDFNRSESVSDWWDDSNTLSNSNIMAISYSDDAKSNFYYYNPPNEFDGDFCEYNEYNQEEIVISDFYYKIKHNESVFRVAGYDNNKSGYYYKPHNRMTLKVFSNYVESVGLTSKDNIPSYAFYSKFDAQFRWRDIYSVGFFDENSNGVNYPYVNDTFYPFSDVIFKLIPDTSGYDFNSLLNDGSGVVVKPIIDECE